MPETQELQIFTASMNKMAEELNQSLQENALKQYHLVQSEVRVLQAQITPRFIYNSLDAIISLIEQDCFEEALTMTHALSGPFRTSLSEGQDWVPLEKEISHISDYLVILKVRYRHMLDYKIDIPETLFPVSILEMILRPLIENVVYHRTKYVRRKGFIRITACKIDEMVQFRVIDNGTGIPTEKLAEIHKGLAKGIDSDFSISYGLYSVNECPLLCYGNSQKPITIDNKYREGTIVTLMIPISPKTTGGSKYV